MWVFGVVLPCDPTFLLFGDEITLVLPCDPTFLLFGDEITLFFLVHTSISSFFCRWCIRFFSGQIFHQRRIGLNFVSLGIISILAGSAFSEIHYSKQYKDSYFLSYISWTTHDFLLLISLPFILYVYLQLDILYSFQINNTYIILYHAP